MSPTPDHFALLQLERKFALDLQQLEAAYKQVQSRVHPDRFAVASAAERRVAMQWAAHANEAYRILRDPVERAAYLCELHGVSVQREVNTAMPASFLMQQMQWREALDEATDDAARAALRAEVDAEHERLLAELQRRLDVEHDFAAGADLVRRLMFTEKFARELARAAEARSAGAA